MTELKRLADGWKEGRGSAGLHDALLEAGFPFLAAHVERDECGVGKGNGVTCIVLHAAKDNQWAEWEENERKWQESKKRRGW